MKRILITTTIIAGVLGAGACFSGVASATCQGDNDYNPNAPLPEHCTPIVTTTTTVVPTTTTYIPTTTTYVPTTTTYVPTTTSIPTTTIPPRTSSAAVVVRETPNYTG